MSSEAGNKASPQKEKKNESSSSDVHSANNWEGVNLGDEERKNKFLRLMGATKTSHQGKFVIGDSRKKHEAAGVHAEEVNQELESQFAESLEKKLSGGARSHTGFGFHNEEQEAVASTGDPPRDREADEKTQTEKDREGRSERKPSEGDRRDRSRSPVRDAADSTTDEPTPKSKYAMSFVKSSS